MDQLSERLLKEDKKVRLPAHGEVKRIQLGIESVLKTVLSSIAEKDERLRGKLLPTGSYYSGIKIGLPDEFDFLYELEMFVEGTNFKVRPSGFRGCKNLWRTPKGKPATKKVHVFPPEVCMPKDVANSDDDWLHKMNDSYVLDSVAVKNAFYFALEHEMQNLDKSTLPRYLTQNSSERPTFFYGPSVTLFFVWNGRFYKNLKISADLTVCLKVINWKEHFDFLRPNFMAPSSCLRKIIEKEIHCNGYHLVPYISDRGHIQWKLSTSHFEKIILSRFPDDSLFKQVIRIMKSTKEKFLKVPPDPLLIKDKAVASVVHLARVYFGKDYGELKHMVSSYLIKNVVFHLCGFATHEEWRKASLSTLYLLTLTSLYGSIMKTSVCNFFLSQDKLGLPNYGDVLPGFQKIFREIDIDSIHSDSALQDLDMYVFDSQPFDSASLVTFCKLTKDHIEDHCHFLWG